MQAPREMIQITLQKYTVVFMFLKYCAVNSTVLRSFSPPQPTTTFEHVISRNTASTFCLLSQQLALHLPVSQPKQEARGLTTLPLPTECTCACSHAVPSRAGSRLWCEGHPRSGSPASAASPASPSLLVPGVLCLAGERRTGASPHSSLPSTAAGHQHYERTQHAGWAVCLSWRRARHLQSGNLGSPIQSRFQLRSLQTASWS